MAAGAIVTPAPATPAREPLPETRVARVPTILQLESVECGAAALAMVLAHHGRHVTLETLRVECGVSRDGSKAGSLLRAARTYGLVARGFRKEPRALADLPMPTVLFWNFNHFVVLEGFRDGHAVLNDPALGRRHVGAEEFDSSFTGVVLTFERGPEFQPGGDPPSVLRSLAKHIGDLKPALAFAVFVGIALVAPGLVLPWLMGRFVDDVLVSQLGGLALPLLFGLAGAAILRTSLVWVQAQLLTETFARASLAATRRFFAHALSLPMEFYVQRSPGEISSRVDLNDRVAETISSDLAHLVLDALTASFFLLLMVRLEATLTLVVVACLLLELAVWRVLANRTAEISQQISVRAGKLAGTATGALANIEGIKAAGQEQALFVRWIGLQVQYVNASVRAERLALTLGQVPPLLSLAAHLAVLGLGTTRVIEGSFTVGQLVAFQVLLAGFTAPVHGLFAATQQVQTLRGDLARLDDVLNYPQEPGIGVLPHAGTTEAGPRSLAFTNVSFAYARGEPPLIDDFSLALAPGQRVALVGASGSGKSTLGRLAAGLYRPTQGEITFEGRPREAWNRDVLARAVAYVDQDIVLFQGTVRENLRLWNEAITEDALRSALRDAGLEDEILARPGGLDAPLQEGARNLSGGQRQRLEIARALARDPHIIILDEATSALDPKAESLVNDGLRRRGIACLIIAHRLSTVRDVDEVIVLKGGRVIERGAPGELLARADSHYARLAAAEARDYG